MNQMQQAARHFQDGEFKLAESCCRSVLTLTPDLFDARHLLALSLLQQGQAEAAVDAMVQADRLHPGNSQLRINLVQALVSSGRLEQACTLLAELLELDSQDIRLRFQRASLLIRLEQLEQAETEMRRVLEMDPGHLAANGAMAQMLEQTQQDDAALLHANVVLRANPDHFVAAFSRAKVLLRQGREIEAQEIFDRLLETTGSRVNRSLVLTALGKMQDRAGNFDQAYARFSAANQELLDSSPALEVRDTSVYSLSAMRELDLFFDQARLQRWPELSQTTAEPGLAPVFLVGFPRSGTTLLDRILAAHPGVAVVEEQATLHLALSRFVQGDTSLKALESMDQKMAISLRKDYRHRLLECLGEFPGPDQVIIDKLPLNLIFVGLIYRIFPDARFIFAIRDPRDVCLSCFMQSFGLNDAMSHFLQLQTTAHYYHSAMNLGLRQLDGLPVAQHHCRYEDLIDSPEKQARALLAFLQLPWDSSVMNFHEQIKGQRINTPSYEQVARPLYRSALGRWKNYQAHLQPILAQLQPFVDRFGYSSGPGK